MTRTRLFKSLLTLFLSALLLAACGAEQGVPQAGQGTTGKGTATVTLPGHKEPRAVTYDVVGGRAILEGDIILGRVDAQGALIPNEALSPQGVARDGNGFRWPLGVVPYRIDNRVPFAGVQQIMDAVAHWESKTKLRFAPHSGQRDYVEFVLGTLSDYCSSAIGRQGGRQEIVLTSSGDCSTPVLIHELGHAVGLYHEQSREDRNRYVRIVPENITPGREDNFFQQIAASSDVGPYDYKSVMHYDCKAFSKNGLSTILLINPPFPLTCADVGHRSSLSAGDTLAVGQLYPSFYSLGGGLVGAPAVVSRRACGCNNLSVFVRGTDNALWTRERVSGSVWTPWRSLGGYLTSDPAAVSWSGHRIDVFARGANNQLIHKWLSDDFEWSGWESLGGILNGAPAVSSRGNGKLDVFVRGTDNGLHHKYFAGSWSGWEPQGGLLTSAPASVSWNGSRIDIFARGTGNTLIHKWWDGAWHSWEVLGFGGFLLSGPTVASWGPNRLDVFVRGAGDKIYHKVYNGQWMGWEYLEGYTRSDPEAIARGPNRLDVFVTGLDNALWHKGWNGN